MIGLVLAGVSAFVSVANFLRDSDRIGVLTNPHDEPGYLLVIVQNTGRQPLSIHRVYVREWSINPLLRLFLAYWYFRTGRRHYFQARPSDLEAVVPLTEPLILRPGDPHTFRFGAEKILAMKKRPRVAIRRLNGVERDFRLQRGQLDTLRENLPQ